jgi:formyl-CoA transferase
MLIDIPSYRGSGIPIKMSRTAGSVRRPPPVLGGDTRAICREAGLTNNQIDALLARGIIFAPAESEA